MSSDRHMDMSIRTGSQLVTRPGHGARRDERERSLGRWETYDRIAQETFGEASRLMGPPAEVRELVFRSRYLLVGSPAEGKVPLLQTADDDTQIEMFGSQMCRPVSIYNLDTGEKISLLV